MDSNQVCGHEAFRLDEGKWGWKSLKLKIEMAEELVGG